MNESKTLREISCADDYDPDSMPVERARELIRTFLVPVTATERIHIRASLGRILAIDVRSPVAVPAYDNSAMDGYAVRFGDLAPDRETVLARVGESFAGKPSGAVVDFRYLVKDVRSELAYTVAIERAQVLHTGQTERAPHFLRVTMLFRFDRGAWRIVHRHADTMVDLVLPTSD